MTVHGLKRRIIALERPRSGGCGGFVPAEQVAAIKAALRRKLGLTGASICASESHPIRIADIGTGAIRVREKLMQRVAEYHARTKQGAGCAGETVQ